MRTQKDVASLKVPVEIRNVFCIYVLEKEYLFVSVCSMCMALFGVCHGDRDRYYLFEAPSPNEQWKQPVLCINNQFWSVHTVLVLCGEDISFSLQSMPCDGDTSVPSSRVQPKWAGCTICFPYLNYPGTAQGYFFLQFCVLSPFDTKNGCTIPESLKFQNMANILKFFPCCWRIFDIGKGSGENNGLIR